MTWRLSSPPESAPEGPAFRCVTVCQGCHGVLPPRARLWCSEKCRKASYGQWCVDCGKRTSHGAKSRRLVDPRCRDCADKARTVWTREVLVAAIRRWNTEHGEPPATADWDPTAARRLNDPERAARVGLRRPRQAGDWPHAFAVIREFGSWGAGIRAAGFEPRPAHGGGGNELRHRNRKVAA